MSTLKQEAIAHALRDDFKLFTQPRDFGPGDLITWKSPNMAIMKSPEVGSLAVCIKLLDEPIILNGDKDSGSPYFAETKDMLYGVYAPDDSDFLVFAGNSSRFKKFSLEAE